MKKIIAGAIAVAGIALAGNALAQSNVTIYGIVDTGLVYTTNANAAGNSVFKMPGLSGEFPSPIGFKGVEDPGDGLKVTGAAKSLIYKVGKPEIPS
jgi:predicted porin